MTREEINELALSKIDKTDCLILELVTGYGKTKIAIDIANHIYNRVKRPTNTLIVVAKTVHKSEWRKEIKKWGGLNTNFIIECYESLKNHENEIFDLVILDEVQHLSLARREILETIYIEKAIIGLSATIKQEMRDYFEEKYNAEIIKCGLKEAVEDNILPEPIVYLFPLGLDNSKHCFKARRFGKDIITTQKGYYDSVSSLIEWYKNKYFSSRNTRTKNLWLSEAGKRLKWCSEQKEYLVLSILNKFRNYKTLTFCSSIEQSERLGKYNITSKNKESIKNYEMFNQGKIKHITAVNILNEGVNITDCRIGIFCNINSSEIIVKQRIGRLLRHKSPIIIVPYFRNTREEELVQVMTEEYNKESIRIINNINEIKL